VSALENNIFSFSHYNNLRLIVKREGLSFKEVEELSGVSNSYVGLIERGQDAYRVQIS